MVTKLIVAASLAVLPAFRPQDAQETAPRAFEAPSRYRMEEAQEPVAGAMACVLDALYQIGAVQPNVEVGPTPWGRYADATPLPPTIGPGRALDRFGAVRVDVRRVVAETEGASAIVTLDLDLHVHDVARAALAADVLVLSLGSVAGLEVVAHPLCAASTTGAATSLTGLRIACARAEQPAAEIGEARAPAPAARVNPGQDLAAFFISCAARPQVQLGRIEVSAPRDGELRVAPAESLQAARAPNLRNFLLEVSRSTTAVALVRLSLSALDGDGWDVKAYYR